MNESSDNYSDALRQLITAFRQHADTFEEIGAMLRKYFVIKERCYKLMFDMDTPEDK